MTQGYAITRRDNSLFYDTFTPANLATTVTLSAVPSKVIYIARGGLVQKEGTDFTVSGGTVTFTDAFDGATAVYVSYVKHFWVESSDRVDGFDAYAASAPTSGHLLALDASGNFTPHGYLYPGNGTTRQTSRYLYDTGSATQSSGAFGATGTISSGGASAGLFTADRTNTAVSWGWYVNSGLMALYDSAENVMTVDADGHVSSKGRIYPGNTALQSTRYLYDDGSRTRTSGNFMVGGGQLVLPTMDSTNEGGEIVFTSWGATYTQDIVQDRYQNSIRWHRNGLNHVNFDTTNRSYTFGYGGTTANESASVRVNSSNGSSSGAGLVAATNGVNKTRLMHWGPDDTAYLDFTTGLTFRGSFDGSNIGKMYASGGFYWGATVADPGANNLQVQGGLGLNVAPAGTGLVYATNNQDAATVWRIRNDNTGTSSYSGIEWGRFDVGGGWQAVRRKSSSGAMEIYQSTNADIFFYLNGSEKVRFTPAGGVYIGSTSSDPGANNLQVQGTAYLGSADGATYGAIIRSRQSWTRYNAAGDNNHYVDGPTGSIYFRNNAVTRNNLQINNSGGVAVGNTQTDPGANNLWVEGTVTLGAATGYFGRARMFIQPVVDTQVLLGHNVFYNGSNWQRSVADYAAAIRMGHINGGISFHGLGTGSAGENVSSNMDGTGIKAIMYPGGGWYFGSTSHADPGANNVQVQQGLGVGVAAPAVGGRVDALRLKVGAGYSPQADGEAVFRPAANKNLYVRDFSGLSLTAVNDVNGAYVLLRYDALYHAFTNGGVYIGASPSDPGANNLQVQGLVLGTFPSCRVFNSGAITITSGTTTALTFDSETWDSDGLHSTVTNTGRLTATRAGKYYVYANISWAYTANGMRGLYLRKQGLNYFATRHDVAMATGHETLMNVSGLVDLAAGEYVDCLVRQESGGNLNINAAANYSPYFGMHMVSL